MALTGPNLGKVAVITTSSKALAKPYVGPFPNFPRPSSEECRAVKAALERLHGPIERLSGSDRAQSHEPLPVLRLEGPKSDESHLELGRHENVGQVVPLADEEGGVLRTVKEETREVKEETREGIHAETPKRSEVVPDLATPGACSSKRRKLSTLVPEGRTHVKVEEEPDSLCARDTAEPPPSEVRSIKEENVCNSTISPIEILTSCGGIRKVEEDEKTKEQGTVPQESLDPPDNIPTPRRSLRSQVKKGQSGVLKAETVVKSEPGGKEKKPRKRKSKIATPGALVPLKPSPPETPQVKREASNFSLSQLPPFLTPGRLLKPNPEEPRTPAVQEGGSADCMSVLDSLVRTILSQNTTDKNSQRAFASLKEAFPTWEDVREAGQGPLAASIKMGGLAEDLIVVQGVEFIQQSLGRIWQFVTITRLFLKSESESCLQATVSQLQTRRSDTKRHLALCLISFIQCLKESVPSIKIKARRILDILDSLAASHGALELEHLRFMSDEEVKAELSQFKGVGPKTVACVLMFCLDRHEFPVDTHVWRISKRLGWVPQNADREATYLHLNQRVPDDVKYDLHCLLVGHGKKCPGCAKGGRPQRAPDGPCPLTPWIGGGGRKQESIKL